MKGVYPDPTLFIKRHIDLLLPIGREFRIENFLKSLGDICPVIDGGKVFRKILPSDYPGDLLSDSLSFALERLNNSRILYYWCPDDQRDFKRMTNNKKIAFIKRGAK